MKKRLLMFLFLISMLIFSACGADILDIEDSKPIVDYAAKIKLEVSNLPKLDGSHYEGWVLADGKFVSVAKFNIGDNGEFVDLEGNVINDGIFSFNYSAADIAARFIVTIEKDGKVDGSKSTATVLEGSFSPVKVSNLYYAAYDTESMGGGYQLRTVTDDDDNKNEFSGVWFVENVNGKNRETLNVPDLRQGWIYEGWVERNGSVISTGKFSSPSMLDMSRLYSDDKTESLKYPGEDFLKKPEGSDIAMPFDLRVGKNVVFITLEPYDNGVDLNGDAPFSLRVMEAQIPEKARSHFSYDLINVAMNNLPSGKVLYLPGGGEESENEESDAKENRSDSAAEAEVESMEGAEKEGTISDKVKATL